MKVLEKKTGGENIKIIKQDIKINDIKTRTVQDKTSNKIKFYT